MPSAGGWRLITFPKFIAGRRGNNQQKNGQPLLASYFTPSSRPRRHQAEAFCDSNSACLSNSIPFTVAHCVERARHATRRGGEKEHGPHGLRHHNTTQRQADDLTNCFSSRLSEFFDLSRPPYQQTGSSIVNNIWLSGGPTRGQGPEPPGPQRDRHPRRRRTGLAWDELSRQASPYRSGYTDTHAHCYYSAMSHSTHLQLHCTYRANRQPCSCAEIISTWCNFATNLSSQAAHCRPQNLVQRSHWLQFVRPQLRLEPVRRLRLQFVGFLLLSR